MFPKALLLVIVGVVQLAISGGPATAQEVDQSGIPCPSGGCQQMIKEQIKKQRKHQQIEQAHRAQEPPQGPQAEDERGYDSVGQDPDKSPMSKDHVDPDDAAALGDDGPQSDSVLGHRNIPK